MTEIIASLGVLLGVALIVYFSLKEINIVIAAPIATSFVILLTRWIRYCLY